MVDLFTLQTDNIVSCLWVDNYVLNGRLIMAMGTEEGSISVYYIDKLIEAGAEKH